jgi:hypothetical protein
MLASMLLPEPFRRRPWLLAPAALGALALTWLAWGGRRPSAGGAG